MSNAKAGRYEWLIPASLLLLSLVPAIGGMVRIADVTGGEVNAANARFHAMPLPIVLHVLATIPYSIIGAFQFAPSFRRRNRPWHRAAGKFLVVCALIVAITGLWMTLTYPPANNDGVAVYVERLIVGSAMLLSIVLGADAVRRRDFAAHGAWMIRAYALGLGAGTQVLTHLPWFILSDVAPPELPRGVMMGSAWLINALFAEWIIRRNATSRKSASRGTTGQSSGQGRPRLPSSAASHGCVTIGRL